MSEGELELEPRLTAVRQRKAASAPAAGPAAARKPAPTKSSLAAPILKLVLALVLVSAAFLAYINVGERTFSMKALSAYDGSNEALPVYISIDGVVYDVSANRRVYGKGGSYNMM